jgi:O-methyltransferase/aklanonic acid methyltransferase
VADAKETVVGIFTRAAEFYDEVEPRSFSWFGRRLVERAGVEGAEVLDVATGRGAVLLPAAERARRVVGIDLAQPMLERLGAEVQARRLANVELRLLDGEALDFPDASFDVVLCGFGIFFFDDPAAGLRGFRRVLRPGGVAALSTFSAGDPRWQWARDELRGRAGWRPVRPFETADDLRALFEEAGYESVDVREEPFDATYDDAQHWWRWTQTHASGAALRWMTEAEREDFRARAFARIEETREADGKLHNVITAALGTGRTP